MDKRLYAAALRYLGKRPRSEKEVRDFLEKRFLLLSKKKKLDDESRNFFKPIQENVLNKLKSQKFVNDVEFAKGWIEQRTRVRPKGWRAIEFELRQKGINKNIIKNLEFKIKNENEEYKLERNEKQLALDLAQKKIRTIKDLSKEKIYQRIGGFLARRGFDMDIIRSVIDEVLKKNV